MRPLVWIVGVWLALVPALALAQEAAPSVPVDEQAALDPWGPDSTPVTTVAPVDLNNPLSVMQNAGQINGGGLSASISIVVLLTIISLAPALLVMCTSFTRVIIVLGLMRQAIGTQSLPPGQVLLGLSVFLTLMIMAPTFDQINEEALKPLQENQITTAEAWENTKAPLREFMIAQIEYAGNEDGVIMLLTYRGVDTQDPSELTWEDDVDLLTLIPAFVLSELKVAFLMGFRLYLPFLVIDMVISSVLISMGMMMLPPVLISLPFKLLLFVLVDGWRLVVGNLITGFDVPGAAAFVATVIPPAMGFG